MAYPAPEGTELVEHVGAGVVFDVAIVRDRDRDRDRDPGRAGELICKRLAPRVLREPAGRAAIVREARALAMARHPALPALVRVGTDGYGPFVIETRRLGVSLQGLLDGWSRRGGRPPRTLVAHVVRAAIEALAEVQELCDAAGPIALVHGDITPEHVLLGPIGDIGLVDFGAARFRGMEKELETEDRGTLPFVAPEIARGESPPTAQGDVYAMAATLAFFATGAPLTRAREQAAALLEIGESGVRLEALAAEGALSAGERAALARALAIDPGERPATARALLELAAAG